MRRTLLVLLATLMVSGCATHAKTWTVEIPENPTTGYTLSWKAEGEGQVELVHEDYVRDSQLIGAGGRHVYRFKGTKPGAVTLEFKYSRKWETDGDKKTYQHHMMVEGDLSITELD